ncbi:hypothetical protein BaRGS_00006440 [Batillaria attramentaria]|uniref:Uncharacterized protein n=1 Tax=Batillaria attramentaria TaxID=370345 RepID=A0ABD0LSQ5_9CAEN
MVRMYTHKKHMAPVVRNTGPTSCIGHNTRVATLIGHDTRVATLIGRNTRVATLIALYRLEARSMHSAPSHWGGSNLDFDTLVAES